MSKKPTDAAASPLAEALPRLPETTFATWKDGVESRLGEANFDDALTTLSTDGLRRQPLYAAENALSSGALAQVWAPPGVWPYLGGERPWGDSVAPWRIAQEYDDPRAAKTAQAIAADRRQGLQLVWLRFDPQTRSSLTRCSLTRHDAGGVGVRVSKPRHLDALLSDAKLGEAKLDEASAGESQGSGADELDVVLDAGAAAPIVLALWLESARRRGTPQDASRGCAGCDPLGALAQDGHLAMPLADAWRQMGDLAVWCQREAPGVRAILVSTVPYQAAGASPKDEIAYALATGVTYLRHALDAGLSVDEAASQILFSLAVGDDLFVEIAKLRAARLLWARLLSACGASGEAACMRLHGRVSGRTMAARDPWLNLLRGGAQSFAAAAAGVWSLTVPPFDAPLGQPQEQGRRLAINCHHLLAEEAHLGRVADPAAGSWYVESITDALARSAWQSFQALEASGGMVEAVLSGQVAEHLKTSAHALNEAVAQRQRPIIGVSEFVHLGDEVPERERPQAAPLEVDESSFPPGLTAARLEDLARAAEDPKAPAGALMNAVVAAVADGATFADVAQLLVGSAPVTCPPLEIRRLSEPFEALRAAAELWQSRHGRPLTVQLMHLGELSEHAPRAAFVRRLLATGGIVTVDSQPCQDVEAAIAELEVRKNGADGSGSFDGTVLCGSDQRYAELLPHLAPALKGAGARWLFLAGQPGENERMWVQAGVDTFLHLGCDVLQCLGTYFTELGCDGLGGAADG